MEVRCSFAERVYVAGSLRTTGGFRYTRISRGGPGGDDFLHTDHPPDVGDHIFLWDQSEDGPRGNFVVIERSWTHSAFGSADWPRTEPRPTVGPMLDIIVEKAEGMYRDEPVPRDEG